MTWPVALLLVFAFTFALALVGAICGMLGMAICGALARCFRAVVSGLPR